MSDARQQFLENMANACVSSKDNIILAALNAYAGGEMFMYNKGDLSITHAPNGDEIWSYRGDPLIMFHKPQYSWQQSPDKMLFDFSQSYVVLFDIEDTPTTPRYKKRGN